MVWQPEIDELNKRKELAHQMGGPEGIERQHARHKLTVRERIERLTDPGSFDEIGEIAGSARYDGVKLVSFTPGNHVMGTCKINGRRVVLDGGDYTIRGGAADAAVRKGSADALSLEWRLPRVHLLDATGGSVRTFEQIGRTYIPDNPGVITATQLLRVVPVVCGVMGSVAGLPAIQACMAHFNLMIKGTSQIFAGGPPVVKAALGYDVTKEDLGDYRIQAYIGGVVDNVAEDEDDAFRMIKQFLSYLPDNVWEMAPYVKPTDDPDRREEKLLSIIPRNTKRGYNPYQILKMVMDTDSFFEICPFYGRSRIVGFARANGYPVGVMINNPLFLGGSLDVAAGNKIIRFLQLCDTFHLPVVCFADEPGFMVGLEAQRQGVVRAGARLVCAMSATRMPWLTFITRQLYGVAGGCHIRPTGMFRRYAWPSGSWGSMHIQGGTSAAYKREIEAAPDPQAKLEEIEARLQAMASPFRTAEAGNIEAIVDPRDTRRLMCDFVEQAQVILKSQLGTTEGMSFLP